ncbi:MAG: ABC1 kinase family protein [Dehalococcoidia bacterium]
MDSLERTQRFLAVGSLAAHIYLGYKAISFRQRYLGLGDAAARRSAHHTWCARRIYRLAVRLQGLLIKFGQILGSRPDLIPEEYIVVLSRLQDQVPPRPYPIMERVLASELGRPVAEMFPEFERRPIASASLAQVHRARLPDGRLVAVKVQYPDIEETVRLDLHNIGFLLRLLNRLESGLNFAPLIEELSQNVPLELDFINEAHNAEAIARNFDGRPEIIVPKIVWEHTTRRVLTMEYLDGIKITDVAVLAAAGIDAQAVAQLVTDAYCEQIFVHGMFHADPHPGNLFVLPGPRLVLLDFGLCRRLDEGFRRGYARLAGATLVNEGSAMVEAFRALGFRTRSDDPAAFLALGHAFIDSAQPGRAYADPDLVAQVNARLARVLRANPILDMPREFLLLLRVMGLLSGLGKHLDSRVDILSTVSSHTKAGLEASPGTAGIQG